VETREAIEAMFQKAGVSYFTIHGGTPNESRQPLVNTFQTTDEYSVALLSIGACKTGLTLTAANSVFFAETTFGPDDCLQAEARAHRMGQKNTVNIFYLMTPKSTDDIVFGLVCKKERESSKMLDGKESHMRAIRRGGTEKIGKMLVEVEKFRPAPKRKRSSQASSSSSSSSSAVGSNPFASKRVRKEHNIAKPTMKEASYELPSFRKKKTDSKRYNPGPEVAKDGVNPFARRKRESRG
jgi:hypothetical protein